MRPTKNRFFVFILNRVRIPRLLDGVSVLVVADLFGTPSRPDRTGGGASSRYSELRQQPLRQGEVNYDENNHPDPVVHLSHSLRPFGFGAHVPHSHLPRYSGILLKIGGLARGASAHQFAKLEYDRVRDAVKYVVSHTFSTHKPSVEEDLKMFRDVGLTSLQRVYNLVNGERPLFKNLQDAQTTRFS
jgi:hypothetical protein